MQNMIHLLRQTLSPLYDSREANAIIDLLLEEVCGISRTDRILHPERILSSEEYSILKEINRLLASGAPVQYALGYEYFMGRKFVVNSSVLIPRPETAELVDWIAGEIQNRRNTGAQKVIDIGTGSGCIALSLATLINNSFIIAADLSTVALAIAHENAQRLNISNVDFVQMDILSEEAQCFQHPNVDKFDVIVSNPPYIMNREKEDMDRNVLDFEPSMALFVPDDDPLCFYRAIGNFGLRHLHNNGRLFFEINASLGSETCQLLESLGYKDIEMKKDINGKNRMICATKLQV